ncbi:MAG TPA: hypothetical protein VMH34_08220 [Gammaproteobacteria bacterium]|nr:hypothetical protein [Gammaproteobacteria bacterium]
MKHSISITAVIGLAAGLTLGGCDKRPPPPTPQTSAAKQTIDKVTNSVQQSMDANSKATQQAIDQSENGGKTAESDNK